MACLNCETPLPILQDYCSDLCSIEYNKNMIDKYPDYEKRDDEERCAICGSSKTKIIGIETQIAKMGNVLTHEPEQDVELITNIYKCLNCKNDYKNMNIGDEVVHRVQCVLEDCEKGWIKFCSNGYCREDCKAFCPPECKVWSWKLIEDSYEYKIQHFKEVWQKINASRISKLMPNFDLEEFISKQWALPNDHCKICIQSIRELKLLPTTCNLCGADRRASNFKGVI